jgi:hypothetical protein
MLIVQKVAAQGKADPMLHQNPVARLAENPVVRLADPVVVPAENPVVRLAENPVVRLAESPVAMSVCHSVEKVGLAEVQQGAGLLALT